MRSHRDHVGRGGCGRGQGVSPQGRAVLLGAVDSPSPMPEFSRTPQENHMAEERVRASSSSSSLFTLNRPNGLQSKTKSPCHSPQADSQGCACVPGSSSCSVPLLAHSLCYPAILAGSHCCCSHHILSTPERSSGPAQLQPLPLQHRGFPAEQPSKPLGTGPRQGQLLSPSEELPQGPGRLRGNSQSPEAGSALGQVSVCVPTSPGAGYPTNPHPSA